MDRVDQLRHFLKESELKIEVVDHESAFNDMFLRNLKITAKDTGHSLIIPVFDEYKDVDLNIPALWLHLILDTCECYEEYDEYEEWRIDFEMPASERSKLLYEELKVLVPAVRKIVGHELKAISGHDISFGTGLTKKLRSPY